MISMPMTGDAAADAGAGRRMDLTVRFAQAARAAFESFRDYQAMRAMRSLDDATLAYLGLRRESLPRAVRDDLRW